MAEDLCVYIYSLPLCPHNTVLFECLADLVSSNHGRFAGCFGFDYQRQIWMLRGQNPFVTAVIIRDSPSPYSSCERRAFDGDLKIVGVNAVIFCSLQRPLQKLDGNDHQLPAT